MIEIRPRSKAEKPDPNERPTLVVWALRLWMISGALLIAMGVVWFVDAAVNFGFQFGPTAIGVLIVLVGVAYFLLGWKTYKGELQWRSSLSALTCVVVAMLLPVTVGFKSPGLAIVLAIAVIALAGSVLAYRPRSDAWFNCQLNGVCGDELTAPTTSEGANDTGHSNKVGDGSE